MQPTSPVLIISTPSIGSAPTRRREREHRRLDADVVEVEARLTVTACRTPSMRRMASPAKFTPSTLETNGKLRDARRLHSMTLTTLFLARNCTLNGPVIVQRARQLRRDVARPADGREVERLRRQHQRRVAAVHAGVLDVLA